MNSTATETPAPPVNRKAYSRQRVSDGCYRVVRRSDGQPVGVVSLSSDYSEALGEWVHYWTGKAGERWLHDKKRDLLETAVTDVVAAVESV